MGSLDRLASGDQRHELVAVLTDLRTIGVSYEIAGTNQEIAAVNLDDAAAILECPEQLQRLKGNRESTP
jgi:hypothetical protein